MHAPTSSDEKGPDQPLPALQSLPTTLRKYLLLSAGLTSAVVLLGSAFNHLGHKYARVVPDPNIGDMRISGVPSDCERAVYSMGQPGSVFCCEGLRRQDWVCVAAFDPLNKVLTSLPWAYVVPLAPWLCNVLFHPGTRLTVHGRRLGLYGVLFAMRYLLLYQLMHALQMMATSLFIHVSADADANAEDGCWYESLRGGRGCDALFDFSDHVVFYYANFVVPAAVELAWSIHSKRALTREQTLATLSKGNSGGTGGPREYVPPVVPWYRHAPALLLSLGAWVASVRCVTFTTMYMHTPAESFVALLLLAVTVVAPLYARADYISAHLLRQEPAKER